MLHITNGDLAAAVIARVVEGPVLPWRDVLHEGPVRAGLALEELSAERARFIADAGWGDFEGVLEGFRERDAAFRRAGEHDEIVLWFEHDLYDQLQLIQVLDGLAALRGPQISLVCEAEYLGMVEDGRAAELFALRNPLVRRHFQEAQVAWAAFRSPDPRSLEGIGTGAFSFLGAAIRRHLEEFPWTTDGLSRLERQILQAMGDQPTTYGEVFRRVEEDPAFLADLVFGWHLQRLAQQGLAASRDHRWWATGRLRSQRMPRWLGGCEVKDETLRWDPALARLVR